MLAGVLMTFLRAQPIPVRRSYIREHLTPYLENPTEPNLAALRDALPADVRDALDLLLDVARRANWTGR